MPVLSNLGPKGARQQQQQQAQGSSTTPAQQVQGGGIEMQACRHVRTESGPALKSKGGKTASPERAGAAAAALDAVGHEHMKGRGHGEEWEQLDLEEGGQGGWKEEGVTHEDAGEGAPLISTSQVRAADGMMNLEKNKEEEEEPVVWYKNPQVCVCACVRVCVCALMQVTLPCLCKQVFCLGHSVLKKGLSPYRITW